MELGPAPRATLARRYPVPNAADLRRGARARAQLARAVFRVKPFARMQAWPRRVGAPLAPHAPLSRSPRGGTSPPREARAPRGGGVSYYGCRGGGLPRMRHGRDLRHAFPLRVFPNPRRMARVGTAVFLRYLAACLAHLHFISSTDGSSPPAACQCATLSCPLRGKSKDHGCGGSKVCEGGGRRLSTLRKHRATCQCSAGWA